MLSALVGCRAAEPERAQRAAEALVEVLRLDYEARLAKEERKAPPAAEEFAAARAALNRATGVETGGVTGEWAVPRLRNLLVQQGWVFLPLPPGDPGLCLARVKQRDTGRVLRLWGRSFRYRRVLHTAPEVYGFLTHRAIRLGKGKLSPLGRFARKTIYLDEDALARRAGQGSYVGLSVERLRAHAELGQAAAAHFARRLKRTELLRGRDALAELHLRVWLTLLVQGEAEACARGLVLWARASQESGRARAARRLVRELGALDGSAEELRAAGRRAYKRLETEAPLSR